MYTTVSDVEGIRQKKRLRIHEVDNEEHTSRSDEEIATSEEKIRSVNWHNTGSPVLGWYNDTQQW